MTVPLIILAILSIVGGFVGIPHASVIENWLEPVFSPAQYKLLASEHTGGLMEYLLMFVSVAIAVSGIYVARWIYLQRAEIADVSCETVSSNLSYTAQQILCG